MFKIYLIGFASSLVAANPILQRLAIPGQTCPAPTCSTCPAQICPNTSRPAPCQTYQNPFQSIFSPPIGAVQQPNNWHCNKPVTVQNTVANQPINQEILTQLILRKLLSPQPQAPLAPIKAYSQRDSDANKSTPNIINNYIIIPPEFFNANETKVRVEDRTRKAKRKKQSRQRNEDAVVACPCGDKDEEKNDDINSKNTPLCSCENDNTNIHIAPAETQVGNVKTASQLKTETNDAKILPESINAALTNTEIIQNDRSIQGNDEVSKKIVHDQASSIDIDKPKRKQRIRTKNIEDAIIRDFCNRHPTIPEEVARSLLRNLKKHIENQGTLPYSPYSYSHQRDYYAPIMNPENRERQRAQTRRGKSDSGSRRHRPHRPERRKKKPKEEIQELSEDCDNKCDKLVAVNPASINIETETITTEKITATTENKLLDKTLKDSETQMENPDDLINQLDQIKEKFVKLNEIETTTVSYNKHIESFPELGNEDKVPIFYDNGVDEYYPDFKNDNIEFYGSDEECDITREKYHYNTDGKGGPACKRYVFDKQQIMNNHNSEINNPEKDENGSECSVSIPPDSNDSYEESIGDESEEIHFIPPPHLELPDFETKPINIYSQDIDEKFVADDLITVSSYSNEPERRIEMKPAKVFTRDKSGRTNIETVYGNSKVVRYGQDAEGSESDPVITYYLPEEAMTEERILMPDSDTVVVVAKPIRDLVEVSNWETM